MESQEKPRLMLQYCERCNSKEFQVQITKYTCANCGKRYNVYEMAELKQDIAEQYKHTIPTAFFEIKEQDLN